MDIHLAFSIEVFQRIEPTSSTETTSNIISPDTLSPESEQSPRIKREHSQISVQSPEELLHSEEGYSEISDQSADEQPHKRPNYGQLRLDQGEVPAADFEDLDDLFHDDVLVIILVGKDLTPYEEPKKLLYYWSNYLAEQLEDDEDEDEIEEIVLLGVETHVWEMVNFYMYNAYIDLSDLSDDPAFALTTIVDFMTFANKISLQSDFANDGHTIRGLLKGLDNVTEKHVRQIMRLPREHIMRRSLAQACMSNYNSALRREDPGSFRFYHLKEELEEFAADLLKAFENTVAAGKYGWYGKRYARSLK